MLMGKAVMKSSLEGVSGAVSGGGGTLALGLVDLTFWRCCARCPRMVSSASGQYLDALE